ncbi:hypothetical protein [Marilutibacter alkalisoli]|uniref:Flagellar FliJ protein n=1 Tax=Marilutibacter alkalisoli TaxID=2591633 RepID=A0A514BRY3_9GAMM|nr:hypothetical protein [Lysobacter alkalisoli]QDH70143.1 hypothetical protein FKV23_08580 [Lysobacter alkalisoli]
MSEATLKGLSSLLRWREFRESGTASEYRQARADTARAQDALAKAQKSLDYLQARRGDLLRGERLDIAIIELLAQLETNTADVLDEHCLTVEAAQVHEMQCRSTHLEARAQTRAVQARHGRVLVAEQERTDKLTFDRMADLLASARRLSGD